MKASSSLIGGSPKQRAGPPAAVSNEDPACLEEAEPNTTLALKAELQSLQVLTASVYQYVINTLGYHGKDVVPAGGGV